jgi:CheY-like chemotaxis protein
LAIDPNLKLSRTASAEDMPNGKQTILLLGQPPEVRSFLRDILALRGYQVLEAVNVEHAEIVIQHLQRQVDLVLVHAVTPESEVFSATEWRRRQPTTPTLVLPESYPSTKTSEEELLLRVSLAIEAAHPRSSILIVDDDETGRRIIAEVLATAGYEVAEAANGREALKLLAERPTDLLLTEIVMPEREGLQLIQDVRKLHPETRIVAMSGNLRAGNYLSIARVLGASQTLRKPLAVSELLRSLRVVASGRENDEG